LKKGLLKKLPCEKCNNPKAEMHHLDYNNPLLIRWLCRKCHLEEHDLMTEVEPTNRRRSKIGRKHTCSKCDKPIEENRKGKYAYCKKCHAEYIKNSRKIC
jgi:hypothetical protein